MNKLFFSIIFISLLTISGCDSEKYFFSNIATSVVGDTVSLDGHVLRFDNDSPVDSARVQIGYYQAVTDSFGSFHMNFVFDQNSNQNSGQNSTFPIIIKAEKYLDYIGQELILPIPQEFEFKIKWRVPIVERSVLLVDPIEGFNKVFQAIVTDYEGINDILNVYSPLTLLEKTDKAGVVIRPREEVEISYVLIYQIDNYSGIFQTEKIERGIAGPQGMVSYAVIATDKHGYREWVNIKQRNNTPVAPLYPVEW